MTPEEKILERLEAIEDKLSELQASKENSRMLIEQLTVGRCISLPAMSVASGKKLGLTVLSTKDPERGRVYRLDPVA